MQTPHASLIYLYYKCPKCHEVSDEYRVSELKNSDWLTCHCGHIYQIKPIEDVSIKYKNKSQDFTHFKELKKKLMDIGYKASEAKLLISRARLVVNTDDVSVLLKQCMKESAHVFPTK